jgi:hypothetical protein
MARLHVSVVLAVVLAACGKTPTSPTGGGGGAGGAAGTGLAGTWRATRAEFVDRANTSRRVEIVAQGGTLLLVLDAAASFTLTITKAGGSPDARNGGWTSSREVLTLRSSAGRGDTEFDYVLSGNSLMLTGGHILFDVDGDNVAEEAELNTTLARQ